MTAHWADITTRNQGSANGQTTKPTERTVDFFWGGRDALQEERKMHAWCKRKRSAMHLRGTGDNGLQPVLPPLVILSIIVAAVLVRIAVGGSRRGG